MKRYDDNYEFILEYPKEFPFDYIIWSQTKYPLYENEVQNEHLNPIIEGVIAKKNLSMVLDGRFTRLGNGVENLDITEEVVSALNKKVSKVKMDTPQGF